MRENLGSPSMERAKAKTQPSWSRLGSPQAAKSRPSGSAGLALTASVAKELWDISGRGDPSMRDHPYDPRQRPV